MKIAVIGANGRTGREFTRLALSNGHNVRAGIHGKNNLPDHLNLEVMQCNATNASDIERLLNGQEVIVSLIGHTRQSPALMQTQAMIHIINTMNHMENQRIISLTGTGVRFPNDKITLFDRLLNVGIRIIDPVRVRDGVSHAEVLKKSSQNWTIVRVLKLTNQEAKPYSLLDNGPAKRFTSRQEVALALLEIIESNSHRHKYPIIGNPIKTDFRN